MPEVKTKALDYKLAKRKAGLMTETFFTALSEIKGKALIDTLAERPGDVEKETMDETKYHPTRSIWTVCWSRKRKSRFDVVPSGSVISSY